jgi:hypothetical protein
MSKHQGDRSIKEGVVRSLADPGCKLDRRGPVLDVTTLKKPLAAPGPGRVLEYPKVVRSSGLGLLAVDSGMIFLPQAGLPMAAPAAAWPFGKASSHGLSWDQRRISESLTPVGLRGLGSSYWQHDVLVDFWASSGVDRAGLGRGGGFRSPDGKGCCWGCCLTAV